MEVAQRGALRRGRARILAATDLLAIGAAYLATYLFAQQIAPPAVVGSASQLVAFGVLAIVVWMAAFAVYGLYERDDELVTVGSFDEVGMLFHALLAGSLVLAVAGQALVRFTDVRIYSPLEAAIFVSAALIAIPVMRGIVRTWALPRVMQERRALIVGSGANALLVARKLSRHPEHGLRVIGSCGDAAVADVRRLGEAVDLPEIVAGHSIDWVILAEPSSNPGDDLIELLDSIGRDVKVSVIPQFADVFTSNAILDDVEGMPIVNLPRAQLSRSARAVKRTFDLALGSVIALMLLPLFAVCAVAIKLDSRGPVLFRQARRGRGGSVFSIVKFRTMSDGAEAQRMSLATANELEGPLFKIRDDPRVTRVGRFLRKTSIDELPQIWNVLVGQMSLVGPRPFVLHEADELHAASAGRRRLDVTPGMTGLWQVLGRNDIPYDEMLKLDYLYVTGWSAWWDFQILCKTVPAVLGGRGAS